MSPRTKPAKAPKMEADIDETAENQPKTGEPNKDNETKIKKYLQGVRPRRVILGVNSEDMWTIISNVQKYYQKELDLERARFEAVLQEKDREIQQLLGLRRRPRRTER